METAAIDSGLRRNDGLGFYGMDGGDGGGFWIGGGRIPACAGMTVWGFMAWMEGMEGDFGFGGLDSGLRRNDGLGGGML